MNTEEIKETHRKEKRFRNNLLLAKKAEGKTDDYMVNELKNVVKQMNQKKAPGPDGMSGDLFKIMDDGSLTVVWETTNKSKQDEAIPKTLSEADVVTISRNGKIENPSNYTPIALLQSLYKLHAALLRNILAEVLDTRLAS